MAKSSEGAIERTLSMPMYFLHIRQGATLIRDSEGALFDDDAKAMLEARASVREFAIEALKQNEAVGRTEVEVHDLQGRTIGVVRFADVAEGDEP